MKKGKLKYMFDNLMSKGTLALIGCLALITTVVIAIMSVVVLATNSLEGGDFPKLMWMGFMRTLDSGTITGDTGSAVFVASMLIITLAGILVFSILIGLLTTGLQDMMDSLRKGRSKVIESNHTIILGWSDQIFTIISELIEANSNLKKSCIVVMGNKDKIEMDDEIRSRIPDSGHTRIVCRTGNPIDVNDMRIVNMAECRSLILIEDSDANTIKAVLAIVNTEGCKEKDFTIVTVLNDAKNLEVAQIASQGRVEYILYNDIISRIMAQTCRQPGISAVYLELLDYDGDEIYITACPSLTGKTFGEAIFSFTDSTLMGIKRGTVTQLKPPMDFVIEDGDEVIAIAEDDDKLIAQATATHTIMEDAIETATLPSTAVPEYILILGWNENAAAIIAELDSYVPKGSFLAVASDTVDTAAQWEKVGHKLQHLKVEFYNDDVTDRKVLNALMAKNFHHVVLLSDKYTDDIQQSDANTLITLLHLRDISEKTDYVFNTVSEILDNRNRQLAEVAKVNDFIISEKIISLMLAQISENKYLGPVFQDLFDADGSEIYMKPAQNYIKKGKKVNYYTVVEAARRKNEIVIGYKIKSQQNDSTKGFGIYTNPKKSTEVSFEAEDMLIVIAEEQF
jgi:voltage-gated potassium channel Kch